MTSERLEDTFESRDGDVPPEQAAHDTLYSNPEYAEAYEEGKEKGVDDPHEYARRVVKGEKGNEDHQLSLDDGDEETG